MHGDAGVIGDDRLHGDAGLIGDVAASCALGGVEVFCECYRDDDATDEDDGGELSDDDGAGPAAGSVGNALCQR